MRNIKIFLTGPPRVGKTTILLKVISELKKRGYRVGGMISKEVRERGRRVGFAILDILSGKRGILAWKGASYKGPRVGSYVVNLEDLENIGVKAIIQAIEQCDLIVIDEVGKMELFSQKFIEAVHRAVKTNKPVLGTVHLRSNHPLARSIRQGVLDGIKLRVFYVTYANRNSLPSIILKELME